MLAQCCQEQATLFPPPLSTQMLSYSSYASGERESSMEQTFKYLQKQAYIRKCINVKIRLYSKFFENLRKRDTALFLILGLLLKVKTVFKSKIFRRRKTTSSVQGIVPYRCTFYLQVGRKSLNTLFPEPLCTMYLFLNLYSSHLILNLYHHVLEPRLQDGQPLLVYRLITDLPSARSFYNPMRFKGCNSDFAYSYFFLKWFISQNIYQYKTIFIYKVVVSSCLLLP